MKKQQNSDKITALYERLSKEVVEQRNESVSIAHQKQMLEDYAKRNGFYQAKRSNRAKSGTVYKRARRISCTI